MLTGSGHSDIVQYRGGELRRGISRVACSPVELVRSFVNDLRWREREQLGVHGTAISMPLGSAGVSKSRRGLQPSGQEGSPLRVTSFRTRRACRFQAGECGAFPDCDKAGSAVGRACQLAVGEGEFFGGVLRKADIPAT